MLRSDHASFKLLRSASFAYSVATIGLVGCMLLAAINIGSQELTRRPTTAAPLSIEPPTTSGGPEKCGNESLEEKVSGQCGAKPSPVLVSLIKKLQNAISQMIILRH
jgi:hypothetical protein